VKEDIKSSYKTFSALCDPVYLEVLKERVNDTIKKCERLDARLRNMEVSVLYQIKSQMLNESRSRLLVVSCKFLFLSYFFHVNKESVTTSKSKLEDVNSSVAEINQWLNEVEDNMNKLDAVARDQISEKHTAECKVSTQ